VIKIGFRSFISIISSKVLGTISKKLFKGGTNFPGRIALKIKKDILKDITKGYKIILVTGTNGKTTTTSMIYNMLKDSGLDVITNATGANLISGIVACFINNYSFKKNKSQRYAVIEVDEANLKFITDKISPDVITITNLFRDQLDRYGEVYTTLNILLSAIKMSPDSKLILNGDESLLGDLKLPNPVSYYGFKVGINDNKEIDINADAKFCKVCKSPYKYNFVTYNHLGSFYCENCGYSRPSLDFSVDAVLESSTQGSLVKLNDNEFFINQPGTYNIYNAVCAYAVAKTVGISDTVIEKSLKHQASSFGRQEILNIDGKKVKIILVKNPAGYDEAVNTVTFSENSLNIAFLLNDNYADGTDVSWIWDVNFEKLTSKTIDDIIIGGLRKYDMAVRLKVAGLNVDKFTLVNNYEDLIEKIKSIAGEEIYILATYTAMTSFRKFLHGKGYIKKLW